MSVRLHALPEACEPVVNLSGSQPGPHQPVEGRAVDGEHPCDGEGDVYRCRVLPPFLRPEGLLAVDPDASPVNVDQQHRRGLLRERDLRGSDRPRCQEEQFGVVRVLSAGRWVRVGKRARRPSARRIVSCDSTTARSPASFRTDRALVRSVVSPSPYGSVICGWPA